MLAEVLTLDEFVDRLAAQVTRRELLDVFDRYAVEYRVTAHGVALVDMCSVYERLPSVWLNVLDDLQPSLSLVRYVREDHNNE